ncbi:hypothetical protein KFK09_026294 [Dendrobium nobile]|uniref:Uncharacterized protein n=1 Tax=Dendrobium nobile TaxID=94219 RepID=A0A8T3A7J4_DENNO|nr:hypothetical protein KFK09_026294 [Dendrobium nobile]
MPSASNIHVCTSFFNDLVSNNSICAISQCIQPKPNANKNLPLLSLTTQLTPALLHLNKEASMLIWIHSGGGGCH